MAVRIFSRTLAGGRAEGSEAAEAGPGGLARAEADEVASAGVEGDAPGDSAAPGVVGAEGRGTGAWVEAACCVVVRGTLPDVSGGGAKYPASPIATPITMRG